MTYAHTDHRAAVFIVPLYCLSSQVAVPPPNLLSTARGVGAATAARPRELGGGDRPCGCLVSPARAHCSCLRCFLWIRRASMEPALTCPTRRRCCAALFALSTTAPRAHCPAVQLFCRTETHSCTAHFAAASAVGVALVCEGGLLPFVCEGGLICLLSCFLLVAGPCTAQWRVGGAPVLCGCVCLLYPALDAVARWRGIEVRDSVLQPQVGGLGAGFFVEGRAQQRHGCWWMGWRGS